MKQFLEIEFNHPVTAADYISFGGYTVEMKDGRTLEYDFTSSEISVDEHRPKIVWVKQVGLDDTFHPETNAEVEDTENIRRPLVCNVFTGEESGGLLYPVKILDWTVGNDKTGELISFTEKQLRYARLEWIKE